MKADAAAGRAAAVLRRRAGLAAVREQHQPGSIRILLEAPAQALLGKEARDEIEIGLAVLAAVAARQRAMHEKPGFLAPAPARQRQVGREDGIDDVDHALVLPYAAVAHLAQAPEPGHDPDPVTRQSAVAAQHGHLADLAGEALAPAVGQADFQRGGLAQQRVELDMGAGREDDDVARADLLQGITGGKSLDQQASLDRPAAPFIDHEFIQPACA